MPSLIESSIFWIAIVVLFISFTMCLGGLLLLLKQKIVVNERGEVTTIDIPIFGKIKTNYPSVIAVFLGVALAFAVLLKLPSPDLEQEKMPLVATITLESASIPANDSHGRTVYLGAIPLRYHALKNEVLPGKAENIELSVAKSDDYHALAFVTVDILDDGRAQHVIEHGSVNVLEDEQGAKSGTFRAILRLP